MRRADLTPRRITLNHEPVERERLDGVEVLLRLETAAVDADVESERDEVECFFCRAGVRMDHASERLVVRLEGRDEVLMAVAGVEEKGKIVLRGQLELWREAPAGPGSGSGPHAPRGRLLPQLRFFRGQEESVIIQSALSDGDAALALVLDDQVVERLDVRFRTTRKGVHLVGPTRMAADGSVEALCGE